MIFVIVALVALAVLFGFAGWVAFTLAKDSHAEGSDYHAGATGVVAALFAAAAISVLIVAGRLPFLVH